MRFAFGARTEDLLGRAHFRGGIATRGSGGDTQFLFAPQQRKLQVRRLLERATDSPQCVLIDPLLPSPAPEILDYLARHPKAEDTIAGILHWWVLDSCIRNWAPEIAKTVAELVDRGFLEEKPSSDGKIFYRVSPRYLSTLKQRPPNKKRKSCLPR